MLVLVSSAVVLAILTRLAFLALTLFTTADVQAWADALLPLERRIVRWWACRGLTEEDREHVRRMRERRSRGLPPF